jgi:hypothetical protein
MKSILSKIIAVQWMTDAMPWLLLGITFVAYGIWIPFLGFYGDDWSYIWLSFKVHDLAHFFESNRPNLIHFYNIINPVLGPTPWHWHLLIFFLRWISILAFWWLLCLLWGKENKVVQYTALLFAVYPGFYLQANAVTFSLVFLLLISFILSFIPLFYAIRYPRFFIPLTLIGLLLSFINLTGLEYFYFLELLRPLVISQAINRSPESIRRVKSILAHSLIYFLLFIAVSIWRAFNQAKITGYYQLSLVDRLKQDFTPTINSLAGKVFTDIYHTMLSCWLNIFHPVEVSNQNTTFVIFYFAMIFMGILIIIFASWKNQPSINQNNRMISLQFIFVGILSAFLAGIPFWLTDIRIVKDYSTTRFYLPFMMGAVMLIAGLIGLLPSKFRINLIAVSVIIGFSIGLQFLIGNTYRQDWVLQKSFFYQLKQRMPEITPNTIFVIDHNPTNFGEENSLSAGINWAYTQPGLSANVKYYLYFIPERIQLDIGELIPGRAIFQPHLIGAFSGSTDQIINMKLDQRGCLRVLDPATDQFTKKGEEVFKESLRLSNPNNLINPYAAVDFSDLNKVFYSPPNSNWCLDYQDAERNAAGGDWSLVRKLAGKIDIIDFNPDPLKIMVFVDSFAYFDEWKNASDLAAQIKAAPSDEPVFCARLSLLDNVLPLTKEKGKYLQLMRDHFTCPIIK